VSEWLSSAVDSLTLADDPLTLGNVPLTLDDGPLAPADALLKPVEHSLGSVDHLLRAVTESPADGRSSAEAQPFSRQSLQANRGVAGGRPLTLVTRLNPHQPIGEKQ